MKAYRIDVLVWDSELAQVTINDNHDNFNKTLNNLRNHNMRYLIYELEDTNNKDSIIGFASIYDLCNNAIDGSNYDMYLKNIEYILQNELDLFKITSIMYNMIINQLLDILPNVIDNYPYLKEILSVSHKKPKLILEFDI